MIGTIKLDKKRAADSEAPARISETGAYIGIIKQAEQYDTKNGATMARFYFEAEGGATAWLSLCLLKSDGDESFTMGIFHAMMQVMGVESVSATQGKIRKMDGTVGEGLRMRELEGKRVGLLLQVEPREYLSGGILKEAKDMTLKRAFDPQTRQTAKEKSENIPAQRIDADLKYLLEHPKDVRRIDGSTAPAAKPAAQPATSAPVDDPTYDDCPF